MGRRALVSPLVLLAMQLVEPARVGAHGDLHARIAAITQQMTREPANAGLHLKRADLHRAHRDWRRIACRDPRE